MHSRSKAPNGGWHHGTERRLTNYPHEFSGGMLQRVMIAIALACDPDLIIADEPTTALDVTVQAEIIALIKSLQKARGLTVIWITHDLSLFAPNCEPCCRDVRGRGR